MEKIVIYGKEKLEGSIKVSGMKNSALPIIFACLLIPEDCIIDNVPRVSDVSNALKILNSMGAKAEFCGQHSVIINTKNAKESIKETSLICQMRASSYLMGAMLSRFGSVEIPMPGGCNFGVRPLDLHLKGFSGLGAICEENDEKIKIFSNKKLKCNKIILDKISVGATINIVLASVFIDGVTVISNCAMEPHVDDLISFLNKCGACINRYGNVIICKGVKRLYGTKYKIFPDMIEALTYITYVGICKGSIDISGVNTQHLSNEIKLFRGMGFKIFEGQSRLRVVAEVINGADVVTSPYPCFPTDLHPQFAALLCYANGGGSIKELVFPTRFAYVKELEKMGACIKRHGNTVYIRDADLKGAMLDATDLRAGAALVAAALGAEGKSEINNVNYIVRGYENIVEKIANIGGKIKLIKGD